MPLLAPAGTAVAAVAAVTVSATAAASVVSLARARARALSAVPPPDEQPASARTSRRRRAVMRSARQHRPLHRRVEVVHDRVAVEVLPQRDRALVVRPLDPFAVHDLRRGDLPRLRP